MNAVSGFPQAGDFGPGRGDDSSSFLYKIGLQLDEVPLSFSYQQHDTNRHVIRQIKPESVDPRGCFLCNESLKAEPAQVNMHSGSDVFLLTMLLLPSVLTILAARASSLRIAGAIRAAFVNRHSSIFIRTYPLWNHLPTYLIMLAAAMVFSLAVWLIPDIGSQESHERSMLTFGSILGIVISYFMYRYIMIFLTRSLFQTYESSEKYIYRDYFTKVVISVVIPPLLFISVYAPSGAVAWYASTVLIILLTLYNAVISLYEGISERTYGTFYFILYFCTVEIAPVVFGLKLLTER